MRKDKQKTYEPYRFKFMRSYNLQALQDRLYAARLAEQHKGTTEAEWLEAIKYKRQHILDI